MSDLKIPFNRLAERHKPNRDKFTETFSEIIDNSNFILGPEVEKFEKDFANFINAKYVAGVANGSDAIRIALLSKKLPPESNVLIAANSYFAAPAAILHSGLTPKFFDVNIETRLPDINFINSIKDSNTSAIIHSHLFGEVDTVKITDLVVIHDCSQAHGSKIFQDHVGIGETSTFSFYPGKNLGAFGDAGAISTDNYEEYETLKTLRNQGTSTDRYIHVLPGFNSRMDGLQGSILRIKLRELNRENEIRSQIADRYASNLKNETENIRMFKSNSNTKSTYHLFQVLIKNKPLNDVQKSLLEKGIETGRHYPTPLHLQPAFENLGYIRGDFPNSEMLASGSLSLPMYPELTLDEVDYICENLLSILNS
jgi:dTDP-4-amino-4,6-dideoxygalactose transaminase